MKKVWKELGLEVLDVRQTMFGSPNEVTDYLEADGDEVMGPS